MPAAEGPAASRVTAEAKSNPHRIARQILIARYLASLAMAGLVLELFRILAIESDRLAWLTPLIDARILAIVLIAAALSSVVGFAFSPIAGTILFCLDANYVHSIQVLLVASIGLQSYSVASLWSHIVWSRLWPFVVGGALTIIPGAVVATSMNPSLLVILVGGLSTAYSIYSVCGRPLSFAATPVALDAVAGALGGLIGPATAFPGCVVTAWCGMRGWDKLQQRSIYQPYILLMQIFALAALGAVGGSSGRLDWALVIYLFPAVGGAYLGLNFFRRLGETGFRRLVAAFLAASGIFLVWKGLR
jgi:uncharacterized protein